MEALWVALSIKLLMVVGDQKKTHKKDRAIESNRIELNWLKAESGEGVGSGFSAEYVRMVTFAVTL
jgi:hypothetical protein